MPEIFRTRDVVIFVKGGTFTAAAHEDLTDTGWLGGTGLQWAEGPHLTVTRSDGHRAGFALWGSDEPSDSLTGLSTSQPTYKYVVFGQGSWLISTSTFERFTLASGRVAPITYSPGDKLLFSTRGLWTTEDEWTVLADPRGPNENYVGHVVQAPTSGYLGIQTTL